MKLVDSNGINPVHNSLVAYPLSFYLFSFIGFLIYHFSDDPIWFQVAYAGNIGGLVMSMITVSAELLYSPSQSANDINKKSSVITSMVFKLVAFLLFTANALWLEDQWNRPHPNEYSAFWIAGLGLACQVYSEHNYLSQIIGFRFVVKTEDNNSLA